jgi:hypothetical protein
MLHLPSPAGVFIYSSRGKWAFPPSPVEFSSHRHFYKLSRFCLLGGATTPVLSSGLFIYSSMKYYPSPTLVLRAPCPLCYVSFFLLLLFIIQFFFSFFPGWGSVWPGAMLIWPWVICGSTMCHLAHLVVCIFPSGLGAGVWWHGSPPGFSV